MKRVFSILFALALVLSFSLVVATPVAAATINVPGDQPTIQAAIAFASSGDTIEVAAGTYFGATVNKAVTIQAKPGDTVIINDGPNTHSFLRAGFEFPNDYSGSGTTIRGFHFVGTIQSGYTDDGKLDFAVFSRGADDVTVEQNVITDTLQGITNWHGDRWQIRDNQLTDLWTLNGGGIGILVGANDGSTVQDNTVSDNQISGTLYVYSGDGGGYDGTGIVLYTDFRWSSGGKVINTLISGNDISMVSDTPSVVNFNGIEVTDTRNSDGNPASIYDNQVVSNNIHGNGDDGIAISAGTTNNDFHLNCIYGNQGWGIWYSGTGLVDAEDNWWGDDSGPYHVALNPSGTGDAVSDNVDFDPWLTNSVGTATGTGTASFTCSHGCIQDLAALSAITPAHRGVSFPHGMFSFTVACLNPGQTVTLTVTLPGPVPVGSVWWKYVGGTWYSLPIGSDDGDNIIMLTLTDGVFPGDTDTIAGQITDPGGPGSPIAALTVGWETHPINKLGVLLPWIALLAAIMAGASLLVLRRRRAQS